MLFNIGMLIAVGCMFGIPTLLALWGTLYVVATYEEISWTSLIFIVFAYITVLFIMHCILAVISVVRDNKKHPNLPETVILKEFVTEEKQSTEEVYTHS